MKYKCKRSFRSQTGKSYIENTIITDWERNSLPIMEYDNFEPWQVESTTSYNTNYINNSTNVDDAIPYTSNDTIESSDFNMPGDNSSSTTDFGGGGFDGGGNGGDW